MINPDLTEMTANSTDIMDFEFQRRITLSNIIAKGVMVISLIWAGIGIFLEAPICTVTAVCVATASVITIVLHSLNHHALASSTLLIVGGMGVFLGANLIDPIGGFDLVLVVAVGLPFLIFSWRNQRNLMLVLAILPVVLWSIGWATNFNLFGFHEVEAELAEQYVRLPSALTVFSLIAMELGYFAVMTAQHEKFLKKALNTAETANQAKSEFLSSMSHELRTPLNAILGFAQFLQFDPVEPLSTNQNDSVDEIVKGGHHLLSLINDILDLAKIESGKVELCFEGIDPNKVVDECLSLTMGMAENRDINISTPDKAVEFPMVWADHMRFKQVLINLISNAIKYNKDNGKVIVTYEQIGDNSLRISITDTGDGIPENKQNQLFQPFNRLNAANSTIEGTGIGLVVCKNLVELMKGTIGFKSEKGHGSTFWLELPIAESQKI